MSRGAPFQPSCSRAIHSLPVVASDGLSFLSVNPRPRPRRECRTGTPAAGGLWMTREPSHEPVMVTEVVDALSLAPGGVIIDATVGSGGHAAALLEATHDHRLVGLDRDPSALAEAADHLARFGARARLRRGRFDELQAVIDEEVAGEPLSAVLFDLGVSSRQFDEAGRGFSYRFDAPLDMRMDPGQETTAASVVNGWPEEHLADLFAEHGEGRFARRIAHAVVLARPVSTTLELAGIVRESIPAAARRRGGHPAKRVFQALRVAVNEELEQLPVALEVAGRALQPGGRLAVLSYHSGEDRIVKRELAEAARGWCSCPPGLPCVCGAVPAMRLITRGARLPSAAEVAANPRSSSARLRLAERLPAPWRGERAGPDREGGVVRGEAVAPDGETEEE